MRSVRALRPIPNETLNDFSPGFFAREPGECVTLVFGETTSDHDGSGEAKFRSELSCEINRRLKQDLVHRVKFGFGQSAIRHSAPVAITRVADLCGVGTAMIRPGAAVLGRCARPSTLFRAIAAPRALMRIIPERRSCDQKQRQHQRPHRDLHRLRATNLSPLTFSFKERYA